MYVGSVCGMRGSFVCRESGPMYMVRLQCGGVYWGLCVLGAVCGGCGVGL